MATRHFHHVPTLDVWYGRDGAPEALRWRGRVRHVDAVEEVSSLGLNWWTADPIDRRYYRVRCHDGMICAIYRDNHTGRWHLESIED